MNELHCSWCLDLWEIYQYSRFSAFTRTSTYNIHLIGNFTKVSLGKPMAVRGFTMFKQFLTMLTAVFAVTVLSAPNATAQTGYKIRPGDTLNVEVVEDSNLNRSVLVLPDGSISFPFADGIKASGRTTSQVASALAGSMASNFAATPNVYVSVGQIGERRATGPVAVATQDIFITGEINSPGKLEGRRGMTVLQAIAQGGGLTRFAASKRIQIRRGSKIYGYNYDTNAGNIRLLKGDVIIVPQRRLFE